jgi:hypothetical protein
VVVVEGVVAADKPQHVVDVVGVVDHPLERAAQLVNLLVADAAVFGMILALHPAVPALAGQRARNLVDAGIGIGHLRLR